MTITGARSVAPTSTIPPPRVRERARTHLPARVALATLRLCCLEPLAAMTPEFLSAARGKPNGVAHIVTSSNDVLGMGALLCFVLMLAISPLHIVTGWRWHRVLRRDLGRAMFFYASLDLVIAATLSGSRFPGGLMSRVGGHGFLLSGTLSALLVVPVMVTSSRSAQRWLGRHWKAVQRIVYLTWVTILIHLAFLFAFRTLFIDMLIVSGPLALLRVSPLERWWSRSRRTHVRPAVRALGGLVLLGVFAYGIAPLLVELATVSAEAFSQRPH